MVTIQFKKLTDTAKIPTFANEGDAGMDFYSSECVYIPSGERKLVRTGLSMQFKFNFDQLIGRLLFGSKYELQLRCKSGRALNEGMMLTNGIGTVDEGYRGEIGVIVTNTGSGTIRIGEGDKICQGVVNKLPRVIIGCTEVLDCSDRNENGYGSSGLQ